MRPWLLGLLCLIQFFSLGQGFAQSTNVTESRKIFVLPIREDIEPTLLYLVRRGVKQAMDAKADVLVLDMDTNGGRVDTTEEIIRILGRFKGETVTYVNQKAFSAGALISIATRKIYMAPQSVIGAAAPITMSLAGDAESLPDTVEIKFASALSALVRANAEKNGHNAEVAEAMIRKNKELVIDGKTINEKGSLLTLTDREAAAEYGKPPKPLLSAGTVSSLDDLLKQLGGNLPEVVRIEPTGAEKIGTWINAIGGILLVIGILAVWIEIKTPGFGLPGTIGIVAFVLYFLGGYIAGLSGAEWLLVFLVGVILIALEFFVFPGTVALGLGGFALVAVSLVMAFVDIYPGSPAWPTDIQFKSSLQDSIEKLGLALVASMILGILLARLLPKTSMYSRLVSQTTSGTRTEIEIEKIRASRLGQVGTTTSVLRPAGRAQFGDAVVDVMSRGEMISKGEQVKIVGFSGADALVEKVG